MTQTLCLIIAGLICVLVVGASWWLDRRERRRLRGSRGGAGPASKGFP